MRSGPREWLEEAAARAGLRGVPSASRLAAVAGCVALAVWALVQWGTGGAGQDGVPLAAPEASVPSVEASAAAPSAPASITVHVVGAVRHPGVYVLPQGSRACDALRFAGGALGSAAEESVNLARVLGDGEQLVIPKKGEGGATAPTASSAGGGGSGGGKVDLNAADAAALDALPGVGPATAKKIVDDRTANGPFKAVEDLLRVPGIGPAKLEALKDLVVVR